MHLDFACSPTGARLEEKTIREIWTYMHISATRYWSALSVVVKGRTACGTLMSERHPDLGCSVGSPRTERNSRNPQTIDRPALLD